MVPRLLTRAARLVLAIAALWAGLAALVPVAEGANRRVAISDYRWSLESVEIDLGEHVTWYWIGPDLAHSVTGDSDNARGLDSDPDENLPSHSVNDSFRLSFDAPGTYAFRCKIHSAVSGEVVVSDRPGDPFTEPDPIPVGRFDKRAPRISRPELAERRFRAAGGKLALELDERAKIDAEYFRLEGGSKRKRFSGYERWRGFVGMNTFRFGGRAPHFRARPGRYLALLRATDAANNVSGVRRVRFTIVGR